MCSGTIAKCMGLNRLMNLVLDERCQAGIVPITIHDSLVVEREHEQEALKIISNVFKEAHGVIPKFHVKAL